MYLAGPALHGTITHSAAPGDEYEKGARNDAARQPHPLIMPGRSVFCRAFGSRVMCGLSGGSGDEGGDDVGGVAIEADAGSVVAHGGSGVGVAGGFLEVAER